MSFKLRENESLRKGLRRIMRKQNTVALTNLTRVKRKSRDKAVHEVRKACKKVRALLRLVQPRIGAEKYKGANARLRDAGRPLLTVRDTKILIDVIDKLAERFERKVAGSTFAEVRKELRLHARRVRSDVFLKQHAFSVVRKTLRAAQPHVKRWAEVPDKWSSIGEGLHDT